MKTIITSVIAILVFINTSKAQGQEKVKSLFNTPEVKYAVSDLYFYTNTYNNNLIYGAGFSASAVFNNNFVTGIAVDISGTKQVNFPTLALAVTPRFTLYSFTGNFEYLMLPNKVVNFSIPLKLGVGYATFKDKNYIESVNYTTNSTYYRLIEDDYFFVAEPGVNMFVNLFDWMSLKVGGSYRFVVGASELGNNNTFSGYAINVGVRFKIYE
jgi:hypothetical protein